MGRLAEREMVACREHLVDCLDCLGAWSALVADLPDLVDGVLERTAADACRQARERLASWEEPGEIDTFLLSEHLAHCSPCTATEAALQRLSEDLPDLALLDPGESFTADVLVRTSQRPNVVKRWRAIWADLVRRPRFALEAAYLLTILVVLILRLAGSSAPETLAQMRAGTRATTGGLAAIANQIDGELSAANDQFTGGLNQYVNQTKTDYRQLIVAAETRMAWPGKAGANPSNEENREGWLSWPFGKNDDH